MQLHKAHLSKIGTYLFGLCIVTQLLLWALCLPLNERAAEPSRCWGRFGGNGMAHSDHADVDGKRQVRAG